MEKLISAHHPRKTGAVRLLEDRLPGGGTGRQPCRKEDDEQKGKKNIMFLNLHGSGP